MLGPLRFAARGSLGGQNTISVGGLPTTPPPLDAFQLAGKGGVPRRDRAMLRRHLAGFIDLPLAVGIAVFFLVAVPAIIFLKDQYDSRFRYTPFSWRDFLSR